MLLWFSCFFGLLEHDFLHVHSLAASLLSSFPLRNSSGNRFSGPLMDCSHTILMSMCFEVTLLYIEVFYCKSVN